MYAATMPTITSSENSEPGACGATQRPSAMNSSGRPTIIASRARLDSAMWPGSPACSTMNNAASASSSFTMALLVTQNRSSSLRPSRESESMMKPVDGVSSASASSPAACHGRPA